MSERGEVVDLLAELQSELRQLRERLNREPIFVVTQWKGNQPVHDWKIYASGRIEGFPPSVDGARIIVRNFTENLAYQGALEHKLQGFVVSDDDLETGT